MKFEFLVKNVSYYSTTIEADGFAEARAIYNASAWKYPPESNGIWHLSSITCKNTGETIEYDW